MTVKQLDSCPFLQFWVYKLFHYPLFLTAVFNQLEIQQSVRIASDVQGDHSLMFCFSGLQPDRLTAADEEINDAVNTAPARPSFVWRD